VDSSTQRAFGNPADSKATLLNCAARTRRRGRAFRACHGISLSSDRPPVREEEASVNRTENAVEVRITPANSMDTSRLQQWLRTVRDVRTEVVTATSKPGEQGDAWDFLVAVCATGGAVPVLLGAVSSWIEARVTKVRVKIRDIEVELTGTDPEALEILLKAARKSMPSAKRG
jgi:Effector Associated Constant Component 1